MLKIKKLKFIAFCAGFRVTILNFEFQVVISQKNQSDMSFTKINHYEHEYIDQHHDTALNVAEGVADQPIVNPYMKRRKKRMLSTEEYIDGILRGDITVLSQAITLIESSNPDHYE